MPVATNPKGYSFNYEILNPRCEKCIVMVHGMFGNISQFYLTIAPLLAKKYKVVLFDLKSHGRSDHVETGYDLKTLAGDLQGVLLALELPPSHLVGYSYGALICLKHGMLFPESTASITAIEVPDKPQIDFKERGSYTFDDFWGFVVYLHTNVRENFFRSRRQIQSVFKVYEYIFNHTTFSEDMNHEPEFNAKDYQEISCPVLLCAGGNSPCFHEFLRIRNWISDVSFYCDENGDHGFFMDNVEFSAKKIETFIDRLTLEKATLDPYEQETIV